MKHFITGALTIMILFSDSSCIKNRNNLDIDSAQSENPQKLVSEKIDNNVITLTDRSDEETVKDIIIAWAATEYSWTIEFLHLEKVDFGIPGGENWLVRFRRPTSNGERVESNFLLMITNEKIIKNFYLGPDDDLNKNADTQYDIMQNIPGVRLANGTSAYGDYNGDGIHELFQYVFGGMGNFIFIQAYNGEIDEIVDYCGTGIPFGIIDPINGPAPVEFMTYNGQYGFKVYYFGLSVAGGPSSKPQHNPDNGKWFFYTFDAVERKYVRVGEITE